MITHTRTLSVYFDLLRLDALRWTVRATNRPAVMPGEADCWHEDGPAIPGNGVPATYQRGQWPGYPGASWTDGGAS